MPLSFKETAIDSETIMESFIYYIGNNAVHEKILCLFYEENSTQKTHVFPLNIDFISWLKQMASSIFITSSQTPFPLCLQ